MSAQTLQSACPTLLQHAFHWSPTLVALKCHACMRLVSGAVRSAPPEQHGEEHLPAWRQQLRPSSENSKQWGGIFEIKRVREFRTKVPGYQMPERLGGGVCCVKGISLNLLYINVRYSDEFYSHITPGNKTIK